MKVVEKPLLRATPTEFFLLHDDPQVGGYGSRLLGVAVIDTTDLGQTPPTNAARSSAQPPPLPSSP
jgi:hypothetical protein